MSIDLKKENTLLKKQVKKLQLEITRLLNRIPCEYCDNLDCDGTSEVCDFHPEQEN